MNILHSTNYEHFCKSLYNEVLGQLIMKIKLTHNAESYFNFYVSLNVV